MGSGDEEPKENRLEEDHDPGRGTDRDRTGARARRRDRGRERDRGRGMGGGDRERERGRVFKYSNRGGGDREGATRGVATLRGIGANGLVRINCVSFVVSTRARKD